MMANGAHLEPKEEWLLTARDWWSVFGHADGGYGVRLEDGSYHLGPIGPQVAGEPKPH
jgi:hypothetical protein